MYFPILSLISSGFVSEVVHKTPRDIFQLLQVAAAPPPPPLKVCPCQPLLVIVLSGSATQKEAVQNRPL